MASLELLLSGLALMSLLWAIKPRSPRPLRDYLAVQLGTLVGLTTARLLYSRASDPYRIAYGIATIAVLLASWRLVRYAGAEIVELATCLVFSLLTFGMALTAMPLRVTVDTWTMLATAALTSWLGLALLLRARYSHYKWEFTLLGSLWLALAGSFYGFALEAHEWDSLGYWLTYTLGLAAFGLIGLRLRTARRRASSRAEAASRIAAVLRQGYSRN